MLLPEFGTGGGSGDPPAWDDVTGKPGSFPPSVHTHSIANVDGLQDALNGKAAVGSDLWTYVKLASDFPTSSATAVDITGMFFTPLANRQYEFEACLMLRTATTTVGPRTGLAWATGGTDGVARIDTPSSAAAATIVQGNISAALLAAVGGLPNTTGSFPAYVVGTFIAGATPSGNIRLQMASETAGTNVTVRAGSFLKYRVI
jgi:hypothetical protein